ncbi:hypothetical protein GCM10022631_33390 [Deinococcus rubellus]
MLKPLWDMGKAIYIVKYGSQIFVTAGHKQVASKLHLNVILTNLDVNSPEPLDRFGS